ncbi:hypothetical protein F4604DRAFT_1673423 [Suillus subluteus]|nr:hypothetical protein F4604DRAFT_1673423 [Suillus subluteus]
MFPMVQELTGRLGLEEPGKGGYWQLNCSDSKGYKCTQKHCRKSAQAALEYKRTWKNHRKSAQVTLEQGDDDNSSDGDMESMNFPSMSAGSSHIASSYPSHAASDESHINPELQQGSHVVDKGRTRSRLRRTGITGPYPIHRPSQQLPQYQQNPLPPYGNQYSAPRFGQSSFG